MKPNEVKQLAVSAWKAGDGNKALSVCQQIADRDLYLNEPAEIKEEPRLIRLQWGDKPCQSECGRLVRQGAEAYWVRGVGVWHKSCPPPPAVAAAFPSFADAA